MEGPALHSAVKNQSSAHLLVQSPLALSMSFWMRSIMVSVIVPPMGTLATPQDLHRGANKTSEGKVVTEREALKALRYCRIIFPSLQPAPAPLYIRTIAYLDSSQ